MFVRQYFADQWFSFSTLHFVLCFGYIAYHLFDGFVTVDDLHIASARPLTARLLRLDFGEIGSTNFAFFVIQIS